jgi:polyribonucleotide nucleotidyltransferase
MAFTVSNTADLMALLTKNGAKGIDEEILETAIKQLVDAGKNDKVVATKKMHDPNSPKKPKTAEIRCLRGAGLAARFVCSCPNC